MPGADAITGAGNAVVLRILYNAPVEIDLGAGPSEAGMDLETILQGGTGLR